MCIRDSYISSLVSVATVWMVLLYPDNGPVNGILSNVFGVANPPKWFISSDWAQMCIRDRCGLWCTGIRGFHG